MEISRLVEYLVHAGLFHFSNRLRRSVIWNELTLIEFSPLRGNGSSKVEENEKGHTNCLSLYGYRLSR